MDSTAEVSAMVDEWICYTTGRVERGIHEGKDVFTLSFLAQAQGHSREVDDGLKKIPAVVVRSRQ